MSFPPNSICLFVLRVVKVFIVYNASFVQKRDVVKKEQLLLQITKNTHTQNSAYEYFNIQQYRTH